MGQISATQFTALRTVVKIFLQTMQICSAQAGTSLYNALGNRSDLIVYLAHICSQFYSA
jgi:hypothetical protein